MDSGAAGQEGPGGPWEVTSNNIANTCALESPGLNGAPLTLTFSAPGQSRAVPPGLDTGGHTEPPLFSKSLHLPTLCVKTLFVVFFFFSMLNH